MKHLKISLFALVAILSVCASAYGPGSTADDMGLKIKRLDLLNQILPVLMTKEQIKKILPAIEKARAEEIKLSKAEKKKMDEFEAKVDKAITDAEEKGILPPAELMGQLAGLHSVLFTARQIVITGQVNEVTKALKETLNEGQIKAAANSLNPKVFRPDAKIDEMSDDETLKIWVQYVLMDPIAYDILIKIYK